MSENKSGGDDVYLSADTIEQLAHDKDMVVFSSMAFDGWRSILEATGRWDTQAQTICGVPYRVLTWREYCSQSILGFFAGQKVGTCFPMGEFVLAPEYFGQLPPSVRPQVEQMYGREVMWPKHVEVLKAFKETFDRGEYDHVVMDETTLRYVAMAIEPQLANVLPEEVKTVFGKPFTLCPNDEESIMVCGDNLVNAGFAPGCLFLVPVPGL